MKQGFTLIELLVVIAIIGILSLGTFAVVQSAREDALKTRAKSELSQIVKLIEAARVTRGKTLMEITEAGCSLCECRSLSDPLYELSNTHTCIASMSASFTKIADELGEPSFVQRLRDPWGSPYLFDENEGNQGACVQDRFLSVGPDGFYDTSDDISPPRNYMLLSQSCY
jgi:prepilin-type N-terminal cleavage/methylation domain-containing protein